MRCTDPAASPRRLPALRRPAPRGARLRRVSLVLATTVWALLAGCGSRGPAPAERPPPVLQAVPAWPGAEPGAQPGAGRAAVPAVAGSDTEALVQPPAQVQQAPASTTSTGSSGLPPAPRYVVLGPAQPPRSAQDLRLQFARRLVAAHPDTSYTGAVPDRLLAIPVLSVELNADGSVRQIDVLRRPSTGDEATALAIAAIRRAAPYGDVSRLPRPWKVVETFLFDDDLRFKPRTLDVD